jgi:hypothetical protein
MKNLLIPTTSSYALLKIMKNIMDFKTAKVNLIIQGTYFLNTKGSNFKDRKEQEKKYTKKVNSIPHLYFKKNWQNFLAH